MLSKQDLLASVLTECDIAKHLFTKLPAGGLDYRLSAGQRNTLELLRYLSYCGIGGARAMIDGNWDGYKEWAGKHGSISADEFPAAMDRQAEALKATFAAISDKDFAGMEVTHPGGAKMPLQRALVETCLKWMVGYRMQLFLQIKAAGNTEIGTPDCWVGVSRPPAKPA